MTSGGKKVIGPVLLKFGVAVALSFAGFLYARFKTRRVNPSPPSSGDDDNGIKDDLHGLQIIPSSFDVGSGNHEEATNPKATGDALILKLSRNGKPSRDNDAYLLPDFDDLIKEFDSSLPYAEEVSPKNNVKTLNPDGETPKVFNTMSQDYEQEIRHLRNIVKVLRERERCLEVQLLEYYGLKEQETAVMELQNRVKINNMEAKLFTLKIESLQAENRRLQAQVADQAKVLAELEAARSKVESLKMKLMYDAEQKKEQITMLQQRVANLQDQERKVSGNNSDTQLQLQRLENEVEDLRESNMRLRAENSELTRRLESTQILATSVLKDPEVEELREKSCHLEEENKGLAHEIERLQADRCADVEELVYLRWLNACFRYELRNYRPQPGKTVARELNKSLSPKSEEKAKQLILEYANTEGSGERGPSTPDFDSDQWSSSQGSYLTDSGELDEASIENSSSATRTNTSSKKKFFTKLKRLVRGKDRRPHHSKVSSVEKNSPPQEMQATSPHYSSGVSTDAQSYRCASPTRGSSRLSLDIQRLRNVNCGDENLESRRRNSSDAGSPPAYKKFVLGEAGGLHSPQAMLHADQKSELVKYAEALKDTRGSSKRKLRRKSASFGSSRQ